MAILNSTITSVAGSEKVVGQFVDLTIEANNPFTRSGAMVRTVQYDAIAASGPRKVSAPYLLPIDSTSYNDASDDITLQGNVDALAGKWFNANVAILNKGISETDLAKMVTGVDILGEAGAKIANDVWLPILKRRVAKMLTGVAAAAGANYTVDASAAYFDTGVLSDARAQLLENGPAISTLVVHPFVAARMRKQEANQFVPQSKTDLTLASFGGYNLVESADMPLLATGVYLSAVLGTGFIGYGEAAPLNAIELERVANGGNGQGGTILHSRKRFLVHPQGFNYKDAAPIVPTEAQLALAATWEVAPGIDRTNIRAVFVKSKI